MLNKRTLVSVIVPVYNVENYLQECIDSIREQSYENIEILLINDGSTDKSPILCESYSQADKRVRVLHKENGGLISAWIHGIKSAQGEYVCFVDSDDWIDPDMIENLIKKISGNCKEVICSNYVIEKIEKREAVKVTQGLIPGIYERKEIEEKIIPKLLGNEIRSIHSSRCMKLISKELLLDNIKYTDDKITMGEDLNIIYPVLLDAERIVCVEEGYYYHYRYVNSSMAHKYNPVLNEKIELLYETLKKIIYTKIKENNRQELLLHGLQREYLFLLFLVLKNELRGPFKGFEKRMKRVIFEAKNRGLSNVQLKVETKANKLLYLVWKHPNKITIGIARAAMNVFDRR